MSAARQCPPDGKVDQAANPRHGVLPGRNPSAGRALHPCVPDPTYFQRLATTRALFTHPIV